MSETKLIRLSDGESETFSKEQADRMLDLQTRMGVTDYSTEKPSKDADNGQPSDSLDTKASKRSGTQTGV